MMRLKPPSRRIAGRIATVAMCCLVGLLASAAHGQQLQLDGRASADVSLPTRHLDEAITQLDRAAAASRQRWQGRTSDSGKKLGGIVAYYYQLTRAMLDHGRRHPVPESAGVVLVGSALAAQMPDIDAQIDRLLQLSETTDSPNVSADTVARAQLAVRWMTRRQIPGASSIEFTRYKRPFGGRFLATTQLSQLLLVQDIVDNESLLNAWPVADGRQLAEPIDIVARSATLEQAFGDLPEDAADRETLLKVAQMMPVAVERPDLRYVAIWDLLWYEPSIAARQTLRDATWLDRDAARTLDGMLVSAIANLHSGEDFAARRDRALQAQRLCAMADRITSLRRARVNTRELQQYFERVVTTDVTDPQVDWFDDVTALLVRRIEVVAAVNRTPFRAIGAQLNREAGTFEPALVATIPLVLDDVNALYTPAVTTAAANYQRTVDDVQLITEASQALLDVRAVDADKAMATERRVRDAVAGMTGAARQPQADLLRAFVSQTRLVTDMREHLAAWPESSGEHEQRRLAVQRLAAMHMTNWLGAWATGRDANEAGAAVTILAPVVHVLAVLSPPNEPAFLVQTLNRWQAMEVAVAPATQRLTDAYRAATRAADQLLQTPVEAWRGDTLRRQGVDKPTMLLVTLIGRLSPTLSSLPSGVAGTLAQVAEEPAPQAYLRDVEQDLALLSWYYSEPGPRDGASDDERRAYARTIDEAVDRVLAAHDASGRKQD